MRLSSLHQTSPFTWTHDGCLDPNCDLTDKELVCEHVRPRVGLRLRDYHVVNEATYKDLAGLIDGDFLHQRVRADALNGIELTGFDSDVMRFSINSSEYAENRIKYVCSVQFSNWDEVGHDTDLKNAREKALMLLWAGDIKLHCTCPSFLFWGYQYILTVLDSAIYPETRKPVERNPGERGVVCKHLNRILRVLPFYNGQIAAEIKNQFGSD